MIWILVNMISKTINFLLLYSSLDLGRFGTSFFELLNLSVINKLILVMVIVPLLINTF